MKYVQKHFWKEHLCELQVFLCALVSWLVCMRSAHSLERTLARVECLVTYDLGMESFQLLALPFGIAFHLQLVLLFYPPISLSLLKTCLFSWS